MPKSNRADNIISTQEARLLRQIESLLTPYIQSRFPQQFGHPTFKCFSNLPLTSLFPSGSASKGNDWMSYSKHILPNIWGMTPSQLKPSQVVHWAPPYSPLFGWDKDGRAVWVVGAEWQVGRPVWDSRKASNTEYWRSVRCLDNEAAQFFRAIDEAGDETDFNARLNAAYPRVEQSQFDLRLRRAYSTSIDYVIARDTFLHAQPEEAKIAPHSCIEYDGITNATVVNGDVKYSEQYVGDLRGYRNEEDGVEEKQVRHRIQSYSDKFDITRDLLIPSTVLPYDSLREWPEPSMANGRAMIADVSVNHIINIGHVLRDDWPHLPRLEDERAMAEVLAKASYLGQFYNTVKGEAQDFEMTKVNDISWSEIEPQLKENPESWLIHEERSDVLRNRIKFDRGEAMHDLLDDPDNMVGIQIEATHSIRTLDPIQFRIPLLPDRFSGSTLEPRYDYCMLAGVVCKEIWDKWFRPSPLPPVTRPLNQPDSDNNTAPSKENDS